MPKDPHFFPRQKIRKFFSRQKIRKFFPRLSFGTSVATLPSFLIVVCHKVFQFFPARKSS
jgi:hypothetical protein